MWSILVGASGTALHADPAGGWLSPNGTSGAGAGYSATIGVNGRLSGVSEGEMVSRVHQFQTQARLDMRHVVHLQQIARNEKSVIKLNCVNDKLVQMKPQLNIADTAAAELAVSTEFSRASSYQQAVVATENVHRLREEADQCVGEPLSIGGESSNSYTSPTPPDDPMRGSGRGGIEPPVYASPYN
ncbi:MAG TPA: hypothetical protein VFP84_07010 [Kofleriaceae bacterium]|nr:hypothetical protein [Kofleriaceae bacterium]